MVQKIKHKPKVAQKAVSTPGKFVYKPIRSVIVICAQCDNKYIKTRLRQTVCLVCLRPPTRVSVK